jgi:hypothetical protein
MSDVSTDDLVDSIVKELRPFRPQWTDDDVPTMDEVRSAVHRQINFLLGVIPHFYDRDAIIKTRENARDLIGAIDELERKLLDASLELRMRLKLDLPSDIATDIFGEFQFRYCRPALFDELNSVRRECDIAIEQSLKSGRKDQVKRWCVKSGGLLILRYSKSKPTYSDDSKFPRITGYIYEIVKPNHDPDADGSDQAGSFRRLCQEWIDTVAAQIVPQNRSDKRK